MTKSIKKLIAVILTLIMAISAMPLTASATTVDNLGIIYYADYDNDGNYEWYTTKDDSNSKITDGYAEIDDVWFFIQNWSNVEVTITNNTDMDITVSSVSVPDANGAGNGLILNNDTGKICYFELKGSSVTVSYEKPSESSSGDSTPTTSTTKFPVITVTSDNNGTVNKTSISPLDNSNLDGGYFQSDVENGWITYYYFVTTSGNTLSYNVYYSGEWAGTKTETIGTVTATPNTNCEFVSWSGIPSDGKITADTTITANFKAKAVSVDKTALESAITKAKTEYLNTGYVDAKYTAETLSALKTATTAGETEYASTTSTQTTVDTATANINTAITNLALKSYTVTVNKVIDGESSVDTTETVKYGDVYDAVVDLGENQSIYKWVLSNDDGDSLLANNTTSVSIVVTGDVALNYYVETAPSAEATTALVKYVDKSEKVVATDYVTIGDSYTPNDDNAPTLAFYTFAGWDVVQGNLTSATKVGIILKAKYTASKTEANKVTIIGLDGVTVQGEESYDAYYDEKVTLAGGTNYVFCKADGTEISSINDTYIYAPHLNETIYIKSVDTKSSNASTRITGSFTANNYFTINAQYYVPDGCTAVEAGVVVSKTNADPTIGGDGCTKLVSNSQGDNHEYSISIKCSSTGTLNTKSYLIYKDASGNLNTVYSDANALSYGA